MRRHTGQRVYLLVSTLLVTLLGAALVLIPTSVAEANVDGYRVTGVGRAGLRVRANAQSASAAVVGTLANRTAVSIVCGVRGRKVYNNTVWHKISAPVAGWVSDYYLNAPGSNRFITDRKSVV